MPSLEQHTFNPEEVIAKLRHVDGLLERGISEHTAILSIGVTTQIYQAWRDKFNGVRLSRTRLLAMLEAENAQLRKAAVDLAIETLVLREKLSDPRASADGPRDTCACD